MGEINQRGIDYDALAQEIAGAFGVSTTELCALGINRVNHLLRTGLDPEAVHIGAD